MKVSNIPYLDTLKGAACLVLVIASQQQGCENPPKTAIEVTYTADLLACVNENNTSADIDKCRDGVNARWGLDAGIRYQPSDAGTTKGDE